MKRNLIKLMCAVVCLMALFACHGALAEDGWEYRATEDGFAQITSYTDEGDRIVSVPDKIDGKWVVSIGEDAFKAADTMKIVAIPGTVTHIHENAFSGRTDFCIRAYNGSAALKFASIMGVDSQNLSDLYFTEGVVDLTGINSTEYSYITNGVRLLNVHARRLEVGSLFFIPADERNDLGEAYEVRAMEEDGKYVNIKMAKADPTLVLTKVKFEFENLQPAYEDAIILSDALTDIRVYNAGNVSFSNPYGINKSVNGEITINGLTVGFEFEAEIANLSIDMDLMPFQVNSFDFRKEVKSKVNIKYENENSFKTSIDFMKVPFYTASGIATVWGMFTIDIELTGEISIEMEVVESSETLYTPETGFVDQKDINRPSITVAAATKIKGTAVAPKFTVDVAVIGILVDMGYKIDLTIEFKSEADILYPKTIVCSNAAVTLEGYLSLWIGIKVDERNKLGIEFTALKNRIYHEMFHLENFKPVDKCTKDGATLSFDTDYEYIKLVPMICPDNKVIIPTEYYNITRPGYEFLGWYYEPEGSLEYTEVQHGDLIEGPYLTVYAHWDPVVKEEYEVDIPDTVEGLHNEYSVGIDPEKGLLVAYGNDGGFVAFPSYSYIKNMLKEDLREQGYTSEDYIEEKTAWFTTNVYENYKNGNNFCGGNNSDSTITSLTLDEGWVSTDGATNCPYLRSVSFPSTMQFFGSLDRCISLGSVTLPQSIQGLYPDCFRDCISLGSADLSACSQIIYIPDNIFANCVSLDSVQLPSTVTSIGSGAFFNTPDLQTIDLPAGCIYIDSAAFKGSGLETIDLPNGLEYVQKRTFENCKNLRSVVFPSNIVGIGEYAFVDCESLTALDVQANYIGEGAFQNNSALKTVNITGGSEIDINADAFTGTIALETVNITGGNIILRASAYKGSGIKHLNIECDSLTIESRAFEGCEGLETITINGNSVVINGITSNSLEKVHIEGENVTCHFPNCTSLKEVYISAVECTNFSISGAQGFSGCTALEDVTIEGQVVLSDNAFRNTAIREITLNATSGNLTGFENCVYLEKVALLGNINGVSQNAFKNCVNLKEVSWQNAYNPDGDPAIGSNAFYNCTSLESVTMDYGIAVIDNEAFSGCTSLKEITLPDSLKTIGQNAFSGCMSLEEIEIPVGVTEIAREAFRGCSALEDLVLPWTMTTINNSAFKGCTSLTSLDLPWSLTTIGNNAFEGCTALAEVKIYDNVTSIGRNAFMDCTALEKVHFIGSQFDTNGIAIESGFDIMSYYGAFYGCTALELIICDAEGNAIDKMADEYDITACPEWMQLHVLTIENDLSGGVIRKKVHAGQNIYPDKYLPLGYASVGYYADSSCTQSVSYPYVMPDHDATIYMACGRNWWPSDSSPAGTAGSTVSGSALTDCTVEGTYYVINGVTTLKKNCIGPTVTSLFIPEYVTTIEDGAFARATALGEIIVQDTNTKFYSRGGMLFSKDGTLLACPPAAEVLNIPADTAAVRKDAFADLGLTTVYGPATGPVYEAAVSAGISYNEYLILYYSNSEFVGVMTNRAGELLPATAKPVRAGYTFAGWSLTEGGSAVDMAEYTMPADDLILHAVWSRVADHIFWMEIPKMMSVVSEEMFQASAAEAIRCHDGIETIEKRAFADCEKLKIVEIHNAKAEIAADTFDGCDLSKITIYAPEGSTAQIFAQAKGIAWKKLG